MAKLPLLLLLVAGALSAPYVKDIGQIALPIEPECNEDMTRLKNDVTSVYEYVGETENAIVGSSPDTTGMRITANIHIRPVKGCMFSMQITRAELLSKSKNTPHYTKAEGSKKFSQELEAMQLLFRVKGGEITGIFPTFSDKTHVLNIKRGILSTLQLGNPTIREESDVNGVCQVELEQTGYTIVKRKNLTKCSQRTRTELGIQSASIEQKDLPFSPLESSSRCKYEVDRDGKIYSVECKEKHLFRPFSAGYQTKSGAVMTVLQTMTIIEEIKDDKYFQRIHNEFVDIAEESLIFSTEHEHVKPLNSIIDRIDVIMSALVDQSQKKNLAVKQNYAYYFSRLVSLVRQLDRKRMTPVWDKYFDCTKSGICRPEDGDLREVYKQYLLDSLTYCGTQSCVYMVHNVIVDKVVAGERMNMFLQGVALVNKPTKEMIRDIANIAENVPSRQAFLTLGTLLYRFCNAHPDECLYEKTNPVTQAEVFLESKLGKSCEGQEDADRVEELIRTLKAIGNSGRPNRAWETLLQCASSSMHQNVSIAALEAMRRMPCTDDRLARIHELLEDVNTDPEIRIHSFLALMKCSKQQSLRKFVHMLEHEKSRQVTNFMYSHLNNILRSSNPAHADTQQYLNAILKDRELKRPEMDFTKYSSSLEGSMYSSWLKSGIATEGHVIFHPESYLPRSGLLNLTANVMGVSMNVLEMAIRIEGLETIIADVFGPHGIMPDNGILKLFNITITKEDFERVERSRNRRNVGNAPVKENIDTIHERVNKRRVQPSGHLSVKMFGHDLKLISYDDLFWMVDQIDNMNVIQLLLNLAKGGHKTFTKSFMFLEMTQTVPVGIGFPLKLKLVGTAVASLELDGKFDIRNMFWGPSQMELKGYIRPSGVAEISGQMGIESRFASSGMLIRSSVYTSQMLKGGIVYKEGEILKINLDAPEDPVTLFNASTAPYLYLNEDVKVVGGVQRRISPDFCLNDTIVSGMGICTSFALPIAFREYEAPYFPFSGPAHYGMKLVKADKTLTTYQFKIEKEEIKTKNGYREIKGKMEMSAVGATYVKELKGKVMYEETEKIKKLTLGTIEGMKRQVELYFTYHKSNNQFEVDFVASGFVSKPLSTKLQFFNKTSKLNRHVGVYAHAKYGSYMIEHTLKSVCSKHSYKLFTKTTYMPGNHLTGEIEYIPTVKALNVRLSANQFALMMDLTGKIVNTRNVKGVEFVASHFGRLSGAKMFVGYVTNATSKKVLFEGAANGKTAEISIGLYTTKRGHEVKIMAEAMKRKIEIFSNFSHLDENNHVTCKTMLGVRYAGRTFGGRAFYVRSTNQEDRRLCGAIFFDDREPSSLCMSLNNAGFHKSATLIGRVLDKKMGVRLSYGKEYNIFSFNSTILYNDRAVARNSWIFVYGGIFNSELKMSTRVGGREAMLRWFSLTERSTVFGVEGRMMKNVVSATATYSSRVEDGKSIYGWLFETVVNKKLPVNFRVDLELGSNTKGLYTTFNVMKYRFAHSAVWTTSLENNYSLTLLTALKKEDFVLFGLKNNIYSTLSDIQKSFKEMITVTVYGRDFTFGWNARYMKVVGTDGRTYHDLSYGILYGKGKSMSLTTKYLNVEEMLEVYFTFKFLKNRQVVHSLIYNKVDRILNIDVEFLPKMFARLMARLDKNKGWKITTDLRFDWKNMNKALRWIARYTKEKNARGISLQWNIFGKQFTLKSHCDSSKKVYLVEAAALERALKLVGRYNEATRTATLDLVTVVLDQARTWITVSASRQDDEYAFAIKTPSSILLKCKASMKKANKYAYLDVNVLGKQVARIDGRLEQRAMVFEVASLLKRRLRITAKLDQNERSVFLGFDALKKNMNIGFAAKYNPKKMSITFGVEMMNKVVGIMVRADYKEYVLANNLFFQDRSVGWKAYVDPARKAIVFNATLGRTVSAQTILEVKDDHIIKFTAQRKVGNEVANETTFQYNLQESESKLILQINKDTVGAIESYLVPIIRQSYLNATSFGRSAIKIASRYAVKGKHISEKVARKVVASFFGATNKLDETFDKFDFVAARDDVMRIAAMIPVKASLLTNKLILLFGNYASELKDSAPIYLNKILRSKEKVIDLAILVGKVAKNISGSARPVAITAFELVKGFKIRGQSVEEMVKFVIEYLNKQTTILMEKLKTEAKLRVPMIIENLKSTMVPYTKQNIGQLYDAGKMHLKKLTFNYDVEKTIEWLLKHASEFKILERTVNDYIDIVEREMKKIPALAKEAAIKMVRAGKEYMADVRKITKEIRKFMRPLTSLVRSIERSAVKHYSPFAKKFVGILIKQVDATIDPLERATWKLIGIVENFTKPILKPFKLALVDIVGQIREVKVMNRKVGYAVDTLTRAIESTLFWGPFAALESFRMMTMDANMVINFISTSKSEDIVERVFDEVEAGVEELKGVYQRRNAMYRKAVDQIEGWAERVFAGCKLTTFYLATDVNVFDSTLRMIASCVAKCSGEAANIASQVAKIDMVSPLARALKEANVIDHLGKYGVNEKIAGAIRTAKQGNLTELILKSIDMVVDLARESYRGAVFETERCKVLAGRVISYLQSIPLRDFEDFYQEVEGALYKSKKRIVDFLWKRCQLAHVRATKAYYRIVNKYEDYMKTFATPVVALLNDVKEQTTLIYEDNKDEAERVFSHYKGIIVTRARALYEEIKDKALQKRKQLYDNVAAVWKKYEDETLEDIIKLGCKESCKVYQKVVHKSNVLIQKLKVALLEARKRYYEFYNQAERKIYFYYGEMQEKVMPRVVELYEKVYANLDKMMQKQYTRAMKVYNQMYEEAIGFYSRNKGLTIEEFYLKGEDYAIKGYRRYYGVVSKKFDNAVKISMKAVEKSRKFVAMVVFPEIKKEMESIFNQTLRSIVVLGNKTVESFSPQYNWLKREIKSIVPTLSEAEIKFKDYKEMVHLQVEKLINMLLKLVRAVRSCPMYVKYEKIVRNHPYVKNAARQYKKTLLQLDNKYQDMLQVIRNVLQEGYVKELQKTYYKYYSHPQVAKIMEILREMRSSLVYTRDQLKPKVTEWMQKTRRTIEKAPQTIKLGFMFFTLNPEEYVWSRYRDIVNIGKEIKATNFEELYRRGRNDAIGFAIEVTDLKTKEIAMKIVEEVLDYYGKAIQLPDKAKAEYTRLVKIAVRKVGEITSLVKSKWDDSALKPIVVHEIWSEMLEDVATHEVAAVTTEFVRNASEMVSRYANETVVDLISKKDQLKETALKKFNEVLTTVKRFVKETTIEDVVAFVGDKMDAAKTNLVQQKAKVEMLVKRQYERLESAIEKYTELWLEKGKKLLTRVRTFAEHFKGKAVVKLERLSKLQTEYKKKAEKALEKYKEDILVKATRMWKTSGIVEQYKVVMKMTLKELLEEVYLAPRKVAARITIYKAQAMQRYKEYKSKVMQRYSEYKRRVERYVQPLVGKVDAVMGWTVNEFNETALFIYKYYGLHSKLGDLKKYLAQTTRRTLPRIPGIVGGALKGTGKSALKAFHTSMVFVNRVDVRKAKEYICSYASNIRKVKAYVDKYVAVDREEMKLVVTIPHPIPVTPSFSHQISRLNGTARKLANRSIESAKKLIWAMRRRTEEIRRDLAESYDVNKRIFEAGLTLLNKYKRDASAIGMEASAVVMNETATRSRKAYDELQKWKSNSCKYIWEALNDIYSSTSAKEIYQKVRGYGNDAFYYSQNILSSQMLAVQIVADQIFQKTYEKAVYDAKPYWLLAKVAVEDVRNGKDFKTAFQNLYIHVRKTYRRMVSSLYEKYRRVSMYFDIEDEDLASLLSEYKTVHREIFGKYKRRIARLFRLAKVFIDRGARIARTRIIQRANQPLFQPFKSTAMVFGKEHMMTFDGKVYKMPAYNKDTCTYLMARDFESGNFTVLGKKESVVVVTPEMTVTISKNGDVKTTLTTMIKGYAVEEQLRGLPVQSRAGTCLRKEAFVKCTFNSGLFVSFDVEHRVFTIQLSGWHYAKTEGLLGSNNNEQYDDFRTPDGIVVSDIEDFVDAWELTGDIECAAERKVTPTCTRDSSVKCKETFDSTTSPLSSFFDVLDPKPFMKVCTIESTSCDEIAPSETSHCNITAAYVNALQAMGRGAKYIPTCAMYQKHKLFKTWTVSPRKDVDIVILVSVRKTAQSRSKALASMIFNLHRSQLAGYNTRYAVVGFGGHQVHEEPHIVTTGGRVFMNEVDVSTAIKEMAYTGLRGEDSNDAYSAIRIASTLSFRPRASRIFILVNADSQMAHMYGPTLDETLYAMNKEADAALFVFDRIAFKNVGVKERVFGQTSKKMYLAPNYRTVSSTEEFPSGPFKRLVQGNGGLFTNKLKLARVKVFTTALGDAIGETLRTNDHTCKTCTLHTGPTGEGIPICRRDDSVSC